MNATDGLCRLRGMEAQLPATQASRAVLTSSYLSMLVAAGWQVRTVSFGEQSRQYHEVVLWHPDERRSEVFALMGDPVCDLHVSQDYSRAGRKAIRVSPCVDAGGVILISTHRYSPSGLASRWGDSEIDGSRELAALEKIIAATDIFTRLLRRVSLGTQHRRNLAAAIVTKALPTAELRQRDMIAAQIWNTDEWAWARLDAWCCLRASVKNLQDGGLRRHDNGRQPTRRYAHPLRRAEIARICWQAFDTELG